MDLLNYSHYLMVNVEDVIFLFSKSNNCESTSVRNTCRPLDFMNSPVYQRSLHDF